MCPVDVTPGVIGGVDQQTNSVEIRAELIVSCKLVCRSKLLITLYDYLQILVSNQQWLCSMNVWL